MADAIERIRTAINSDKIVIFMKGNRSFPNVDSRPRPSRCSRN